MNKIHRLPSLPGYNFDFDVGRTKFPRSSAFDMLHKGVCGLIDKSHISMHNRYPAPLAWSEVPDKPAWLALDAQRLMFHAYFQESIHEGRDPYRIRLVNISFFLEDGTMKVSEPAIDNSGLEQGVLVRRQRIPLPDPIRYRYYDILDLNVGREARIFGRVYMIYNCDKFTRSFLSRMGIPVPDPLEPPIDPARKRNKIVKPSTKPKKPDSLGKFLKYDRKILRFFGYWDDSDSEHGYLHKLEILYYLVDGSMEVIERSSVGDKSLLVKKTRIPKIFEGIEPIGSGEPLTLLNVLGDSPEHGYYVRDRAYREPTVLGYYEECDLAIGAQLSVFGRKVVITSLDRFTQEYYRRKYGLDDFTPLNWPDNDELKNERNKNVYIPPYNGFGSYEDSLSNCFSVVPKRPKLPTDKAFCYEKQENDNRTLRFGARMISNVPENNDRCFVVNVHLFDNTVSVMEIGCHKKPGHTLNVFQSRMRFRLPGQIIFTSDEPKFYEPKHFYIGAYIILDGFKYHLETADEYTFEYMEHHADEFPISDVNLIMSKVRESLRDVYREFISDYSPMKSCENIPAVWSFDRLREAMYRYLRDRITEHEIIVLARHYSYCEEKEHYPREYVRAIVHTELTRYVWQELDRLEEDIHDADRDKTGYLSHDRLYVILRANRIPLEKELINLLLNRLKKNDRGDIDWSDLLKFVNIKIDPLPPVVPINLKMLFWSPAVKPKDCKKISWSRFINDLNLEQELSDDKKIDDK